MTMLVLPLEGVPIYATPGDLPPSAVIGTVVSVVSDTSIRQWNGTTWVVVSGAGFVGSITDTNSIDLTVTGTALSADLKLSAAAAAASNTIVALDIQSDGLRAQVANSAIQSLISVTDTNSIDFTYGAGVISGLLRLSSNVADAGNTIISLNVEAISSVGLRAQVTNPSIRGLMSATAPVAYNNSTGVISMAASTNAVDGYLTAADHTTFAAKVGSTRAINTTAPLAGGGDLSADRTLSIPASTNAVDGYLTAADHTTFAAKQTAITIGTIGAGNANGLDLTTGTLTLHVGTSTQPGAISTAAQTIAGSKTFNADILRANNTTNASFVGNVSPSAVGATAADTTTATGTFDSDSMIFVIEVGNERASIVVSADYGSTGVTYLSDRQLLGLNSDAGIGIYVSKAGGSSTVSIKNRMGGSRVIRVKALVGSITSATAWV